MTQYATPPRFGTQPIDTDDDDRFATPRRPATVTPILHAITCAVCGLPSKIGVGQPGDLCSSCRADLVLVRQHVELALEAARSRLQVLVENFEHAVAAESEQDQMRRQRVVDARVKVQAGSITAASFRSRWAEALAAGDGLSRILQAHAPYEQGCGEAERIELWAARAMSEIEVAE
jgi:hypothetical protein